MALYIKDQQVYLKNIKGKRTKNGKTCVTGLGAFLSSYENEQKERINEAALNVVVSCYREEAFDALRSVKEKPGFITISGKLQTNNWQDEQGEWHNQVELIVLSASIPTKKEAIPTTTSESEEVPF